MNILKMLFGSRDTESNKPVVRSYFSVEFYPLTNRYYPKYKNYYLKKQWTTGIIEKLEAFLFTYADYGATEEEANKIIELFKEQQLKENVITICK